MATNTRIENLAVATISTRSTRRFLEVAVTFAHDLGLCARFSQPWSSLPCALKPLLSHTYVQRALL